jgi:phosphonate transport system substrate-binding protein
MRPATDYAGTVEALKSKRLELALLGGAGYAEAWIVTQGNVEPLAQIQAQDGDTGYYSMVVVKADSPFKTIDDLKGKKLAFADPNSTSGFQVPSFFLRLQGRDPRAFFSQTGFAGNHENAVMAVVNGTYDAAATWYTTEERTNVTRMILKGMIPKDSMRIVWRSPKIQGDCFAIRSDLPPAMKAAVANALLTLAQKAPDVLQALGDGSYTGTAPATHEDYVPLIDMTRANLAQRRAN